MRCLGIWIELLGFLKRKKHFAYSNFLDCSQVSKNMEPLEIDPQLTTNNLHGLVFFTGLDLTGIITHHNTIFNVFNETKREKTVQINYKILTGDNELFDDSRRATTGEEQFEKPSIFHLYLFN